MRQVRTCDFCDDAAAGLYEPYPPSIPDGPRLLLCEGCRDRLSSVVEPLVAAVQGDADRDPGGSAASDSSPAEPELVDDGADRPADDAPSEASEADPSTDADGSGEADADGPTAEPDEGNDAAEGGLAPDEAEHDAVEDADVGGSHDAGGRTEGERSGAPPGYRKVMRFLENRQLPVPRAEAEQLAADAYELDEDAVADAVDHAVRYGRLREVDGNLER